MSRSKAKYESLLKDDSFSNLDMMKIRRLIGIALAEMLGTAFFVFMGCSSTVSHIDSTHNSHLNTVLAFAFGIGASIAMFGHISGALMNPGLNFVMVALGHFSIFKLIYYTIFQVLGAILGVLMNHVVTPDIPDGFCVVAPNPDVGLGRAAALEFIIMMILSFGLSAVVDPRKEPYADNAYLKFAVVVTAIAIPAAKYSGCAMNPARAFAPALLSGQWTDQWMYWVIPIISSTFTGIFYRLFFDHAIFSDARQRTDSHQMT